MIHNNYLDAMNIMYWQQKRVHYLLVDAIDQSLLENPIVQEVLKIVKVQQSICALTTDASLPIFWNLTKYEVVSDIKSGALINLEKNWEEKKKLWGSIKSYLEDRV